METNLQIPSTQPESPTEMSPPMPLEMFVTKHFKKRECCKYVKTRRPSPGSDDDSCACGRDLDWHVARNIVPPLTDPNEEWTTDSCTEASPTDAFGKVEMLGFSGGGSFSRKKFLRLDNKSDFATLKYFMETYWKVKPPALILSINGGAKRMEACEEDLLNAIKRGLYQTSTSLRTWIITPGTYDGVSRLIGQAVHERPIEARMEKGSFLVIGILSWGTVCNASALLNQNGFECDEIGYRRFVNVQDRRHHGEVIPDPNHTHLLFVDDGTIRRYGGQVEFRNKFEDYLASNYCLIEKCPAVRIQLLIEGGHASLPVLEESLKCDSPIIIVKHSGRCADLLCNMLQRTTEDVSQEEIERLFEEEMSTNFSKWAMNERVRKLCLKTMNELLHHGRRLIHVFDYESDSTKDLDKFILQVIFKQHSQLTLSQKLTLAMSMNRSDLAAEEVFSHDAAEPLISNSITQYPRLKTEEFMTMALNGNKVKFVELLLEEGVVVPHYLTASTLCNLYQNTKRAAKFSTNDRFLHKQLASAQKTIGVSVSCIKRHLRRSRPTIMECVAKLIHSLTNEVLPIYYDEKDFPRCPKTRQKRKRSSQQGIHKHKNGSEESIARDDAVDYNNEMELVNVPQEDETLVQIRNIIDVPLMITSSGTGNQPLRTVAYPKFPPRNKFGHRIFTEFDLFLWAILHNRMDLAKVFWRTGKDQVSCALVASAILTRMRDLAVADGEVSLAGLYENSAQEFEALALELLSTAYFCGKKRTHILLCRSLPQWGGHTCLSMAYQFSSMSFLQHTACQTRLNRIWMGAMPSSTPIPWIALNVVLAPFLIRTIFPGPDATTTAYYDVDDDNEETTKKEEKDNQKPDTKNGLIDLSISHKDQSYWSSLQLFYAAPITKFIIYVSSYLVFLALLTYFILVALEPTTSFKDISVWECIAWVWCIDIIVEEIRQVNDQSQSTFPAKFRNWLVGIGSSWNKFDFCAIFLFVLSVVLRFTVPVSHFQYVRLSYGLMIALFYLRFLQFYFAHRNVGPKVVMVNKMLNDLSFFVCIYVIFVMAYGAFLQAVLHPNKEPSIYILADIVHVPFWQTFGELNLDYLKGNDSCSPSERGCGYKNPLVMIFGAVYLMAVNILLINLLIAMFGFTINLVQESSERIWAFYRFGLVQEFQERSALPPPFNIITIIIHSIAFLCRRRRKGVSQPRTHGPFKFSLEMRLDRKVARFEHNCAVIYCSKDMKGGGTQIPDRMQMVLSQLQQLRNPKLTNATTVSATLGQGMGEEWVTAELTNLLQKSPPSNNVAPLTSTDSSQDMISRNSTTALPTGIITNE